MTVPESGCGRRAETVSKWREKKLFLYAMNIMSTIKQLSVNRSQSKCRSGASHCSNQKVKSRNFCVSRIPTAKNKIKKNKRMAVFFLLSFSFRLFAAPSRTWRAAASRSVVLMSHLSQQDPSACWRSKRDRLFELCH